MFASCRAPSNVNSFLALAVTAAKTWEIALSVSCAAPAPPDSCPLVPVREFSAKREACRCVRSAGDGGTVGECELGIVQGERGEVVPAEGVSAC
jgi:hypothetical protein